jgi:hypothetical protein
MDLTMPFEITHMGKQLSVVPKKFGKEWVYIVRFEGSNPPLMLTMATQEKGGHFWTSIPEGRQQEAERIGPLITAHYKELAAVE